MRLGLFGGSFDPVHRGHLELARACQRSAELDEVWFLPAATQPFKQRGPVASDSDRLAMLDLAIANEPSWRINRAEIERGGLSYTVDTLRTLHEANPQAELYFMMGADTLHDFPTWREPAEICQLATPLVVARAGEPPPDFDVLLSVCSPARVDEIRTAQVMMREMPIASSVVRAKIAVGESASELLPHAVWQYIESHALYQV